MAKSRRLRSKEWFFKQCFLEYEGGGPLSDLAWDALKKGIAQEDATRGHVWQPVGAVQLFFAAFPEYRRVVAATGAEPYDIISDDEMREAWTDWLAAEVARHRGKQGIFGRASFGYNINRMRTYLPPTLGGQTRRKPGGVGLDEFKKVLRLVAEFFDRD